MREKVNGVFEGGGSKGLVYAGALEACEDLKLKFNAVAGSSAGAMTACAIACGYDSKQTASLIKNVMKSLGKPPMAAAALARRSVLSPDALRKILTDAVNAKIPTAQPDGVRTFADVRAATEITLYVVTLDMASGQPLIFSPDLTPDASVVEAVLASSAIPVAFPAQRVEIDGEVRRLADGGVWANYPSFVFLDADFRARHGDQIKDRAEGLRTIGFMLDAAGGQRVGGDEPHVGVRTGKPRPSDLGSAPREFGLPGALLTSPLTALAVVLMPLLFVGLGIGWFNHEIDDGLPTIARLPDAIEDFVLLLLVLVFSFVAVLAVLAALVVLRLGRAIVDEGLVGASTAMGVGLNVPYWVGQSNHGQASERSHVVVRIEPPPGLKTLTSSGSDALHQAAIGAGRDQTAEVLAHAFGTSPIGAANSDEREVADASEPFSLPPAVATGVIMICFGITLWLAFWAIRVGAQQGVPARALLGLFVVGTAMAVVHGLARLRRSFRPRSGLARLPRPVTWVLTLLSLFFLVAVAVDDADIPDNPLSSRLSADDFEGTILSIEEPTDDYYNATIYVRVADFVPRRQERAASGEPMLDTNEEPVTECQIPTLESGSCYSFLTDREYVEGQSVPLRFSARADALYLRDEAWSGLWMTPMLVGILAGVFLISLSAATARRRPETERPRETFVDAEPDETAEVF